MIPCCYTTGIKETEKRRWESPEIQSYHSMSQRFLDKECRHYFLSLSSLICECIQHLYRVCWMAGNSNWDSSHSRYNFSTNGVSALLSDWLVSGASLSEFIPSNGIKECQILIIFYFSNKTEASTDCYSRQFEEKCFSNPQTFLLNVNCTQRLTVCEIFFNYIPRNLKLDKITDLRILIPICNP